MAQHSHQLSLQLTQRHLLTWPGILNARIRGGFPLSVGTSTGCLSAGTVCYEIKKRVGGKAGGRRQEGRR